MGYQLPPLPTILLGLASIALGFVLARPVIVGVGVVIALVGAARFLIMRR